MTRFHQMRRSFIPGLACAMAILVSAPLHTHASLGIRSSPSAPSVPPAPNAPESYPASDITTSEALPSPGTPATLSALHHDLELDSDTATLPPTSPAPQAPSASTPPAPKDLPFEDLSAEQSADLARKLKIVEEILSRHHRLYDAKSARVSDLYRALAQLEGTPASTQATRSK